MKILNLYAGIGGNRKLWGNEHQITAVELNPEIAKVYQEFYPDDTVIVGDAHQYLLEHYKEFDFIWASPPCQSHSRARFWGWKNDSRVKDKYPDMSLYQEIIFLKSYFGKSFVVENVNPYYDVLIEPTNKVGRHLFWSSFNILPIKVCENDINRGNRKSYSELLGIDLSKFKIKNRKDQIYRNAVNPKLGKHILDCAMGAEIKTEELELF